MGGPVGEPVSGPRKLARHRTNGAVLCNRPESARQPARDAVAERAGVGRAVTRGRALARSLRRARAPCAPSRSATLTAAPPERRALAMLPHVQEVFVQPQFWIACALAYLLGSIPFGLVFAKWVKGVDLRTIGSGNIGASNAGRALGRRWAIAVFACDFLKSFLPVLAMHWIEPRAELVPVAQVFTGTAAVLGHCYSIYLRFAGGKAVATGCGAIVAIDWRVFVCGGLVWLITRRVTRYNGLASILMSLSWPLAAWALDRDKPEFVLGTSLLALLILVRHRANIRRMLAGTEPRTGDKASRTPDARAHG
jgi:glycerol-3-phosphate acyltransferase PlsY